MADTSPWVSLPDTMPAAERQAIEQDEAWVFSVGRRGSLLFNELRAGGVPEKTAGRIVEHYCAMVFHGDPAFGMEDD